MTHATMPPVTEHANCPTCNARLGEGFEYCQQCGATFGSPQTRREPERPVRDVPAAEPELGNLAVEQHRKHIRGARIAIMFVTVVTLIAATAFWNLLSAEVAKIEADPNMVVVDSVVREARLGILVMFGLGFAFLGMFFWCKRNPFGATLTALIIYVTSMVISAAADPKTLASGWIVKLIIIAALVRGVKAGLAYRQLTADSQPRH